MGKMKFHHFSPLEKSLTTHGKIHCWPPLQKMLQTPMPTWNFSITNFPYRFRSNKNEGCFLNKFKNEFPQRLLYFNTDVTIICTRRRFDSWRRQLAVDGANNNKRSVSGLRSDVDLLWLVGDGSSLLSRQTNAKNVSIFLIFLFQLNFESMPEIKVFNFKWNW